MAGMHLDTRKSFLTRVHGDILANYSWVNDERALILIPMLRKGAPWYIVMESAAHTWDDNDPSNIPQVMRKGTKACEVLGIEPTPRNVVRVAKIIVEGLPDLIRMPSAPPQEFHKQNFGEMHLKANGEVIASDNIRVEKEGANYE